MSPASTEAVAAKLREMGMKPAKAALVARGKFGFRASPTPVQRKAMSDGVRRKNAERAAAKAGRAAP